MPIDIYLTIPGIAGESTTHGFVGAIEVLSFSWSVSNTIAIGGSGAGAGKAKASDISVVKNFDLASPLLLTALVQGTHLPKMTLSFVKPGSRGTTVTFLTYEFDTVFVTSIQDAASGEVPTESVSFASQIAIVTYRPQTNNGALGQPEIFSWDFVRNSTP